MRAPTIATLAALLGLPWLGVAAQGPGATPAEVYEGWRQYSVHCARCHGQDVLGNPVAANLLESAAPGGPMATEEAFKAVVLEGRPAQGMPGFAELMTAEKIDAVWKYVRGRAHGQIPSGRPKAPVG